HILVTIDPNPAARSPEIQAMVDRLLKHGPGVQAGDTMRWVQLDKDTEIIPGTPITYNDKKWALLDITPAKSMTKQMSPSWALIDSRPVRDPSTGEQKVQFTFDTQGGQYFGELSGANVGKPLAIILDEKLISSPNLRSRIGSTG